MARYSPGTGNSQSYLESVNIPPYVIGFFKNPEAESQAGQRHVPYRLGQHLIEKVIILREANHILDKREPPDLTAE